MKSIARTRIEKEIKMFISSPTPGISCSCSDESLQRLTGVIMGAPGTPFEHGHFTLDIEIPDRYPFEPPSVRFVTPIYHPNIDTKGRICLDTLKPPPQGSWKPHLNLTTLLLMIRVLMAEPGAEDPLMADIWQEFKYDFPTYVKKAREWTDKYARGETGSTAKQGQDDLNHTTQGSESNSISKKTNPSLINTKDSGDLLFDDKNTTIARKRPLLGLKNSSTASSSSSSNKHIRLEMSDSI